MRAGLQRPPAINTGQTRVKHRSNTGQTRVKHGSNTGQTRVKHGSNTGGRFPHGRRRPLSPRHSAPRPSMVAAAAGGAGGLSRKRGACTGQALVKHWSSTGQALVKHWSNTGQTLVLARWPPWRTEQRRVMLYHIILYMIIYHTLLYVCGPFLGRHGARSSVTAGEQERGRGARGLEAHGGRQGGCGVGGGLLTLCCITL